MKRHGCDFEKQAHGDQHESEQRQNLECEGIEMQGHGGPRREQLPHLLTGWSRLLAEKNAPDEIFAPFESSTNRTDIGRGAQAIKQRKSVGENPGAESAKEHVFERGLVRTLLAPQETSQHIEAQRHRLQPEEHDDQVHAGSHQHHADTSEQQKRVILSFLLSFNLQVFHGEKNDQRGGNEKQRGKKNQEAIHDNRLVKSRECAAASDPSPQLPKREAAEQHPRESGLRAEVLEEKPPEPIVLHGLIDGKPDQQNAQAEQRQLHLRENDGAVSLEITENQIEDRDVHAVGLFCLSGGSGNFRSGRLHAFRLVESRIHLLDDSLHGLFDIREEWLRIDADPERQNDERHERGVLAQVQVRQLFIGKLGHRAEHHPLVQPQQIRGAQHNAERAPGSPRFADLKRALQNREFSNKTVQQRHSQRAQADDEVDRREIRHRRGQPAEFRDQPRMPPFVEHADNQEERAR